MPAVVTQAIVLRHADYRERDRMLTLLSPTMGRVEAMCRGCKSPKSQLLPASEWFALGDYELYGGKGRMVVTACQVTESFYALRADYDKLKYATYLLAIAEAAAQPGERAAELFTLLARSLARLCYGERDMRAVAAAFLLHFSAVSGYKPRLAHCARCGKRVAEESIRLMDINGGGLVCPDCTTAIDAALPLSPAQAKWMREVLAVGIDKTALPDADAPGALLCAYVEARLEKRVRREGLFA